MRSLAQDGFIQRKIDHHLIRFRVSVLPIILPESTRRYESIVIRVLDDRKVISNLDALGLQEQAKHDFVQSIKKPQGMVILTGPTGIGKSTTLVAALQTVMNPTLNILTVEEPVEYIIPGARQVKLSPQVQSASWQIFVRRLIANDKNVHRKSHTSICTPT